MRHPRWPPSPWAAHAAAALVFAALSVWLTWPLASRLSTHIAGSGLTDNVVFLWNVWWMRRRVSGEAPDLLQTDALFHPGGVDLVLHTHAALNSLLGATVFGSLSLPAALNATVLLNGALNGWLAYLLAWRLSRHWGASIVAGLFFAASPRLAATLAGHFNFHTAWGLPLVALVWLGALERRSLARAAAAGLALALVAYSDYYYFVYACTFVTCTLAYAWLRPSLHRKAAAVRRTRLDAALLGVAAAAGAGALAVSLTGGLVVDVWSLRVSLRTGTNLRALAALTFLWWVWRRVRPGLTFQPSFARAGRDLRLAAAAVAMCAALMWPLLAHAARLWLDGEYVTQRYFWRTAPAGVDLATLVMGNPFHHVWGGAIRRVYEALGMNPYAGPLWMSVVPLVLAATWRHWRQHAAAGVWLLIAAVFAVWAIGPYLVLFGVNTGLPMPQTLLRFVPVAANARVPSHASIVVFLSAAVLLAIALSRLEPRRRRAAALVTAVLVLIDCSWWAVETVRVDRPRVYEHLAALPAGAVLEVPFGIRDGFGEAGLMDVSTMYYQTIHGKPLASGYVSRLSPSVRARYDETPFEALLALSAGRVPEGPVPSPDEAARRLAALGIRYVVVNNATSAVEVREFVLSMPLTLLMTDGTRALYRLDVD